MFNYNCVQIVGYNVIAPSSKHLGPDLVPVNPEVIAVVTLGSAKDFVFEGGPSPWILDRSKYYDKCK